MKYRVSKLYDALGHVGDHFLNDEFHSFCDTWEHAMADPHFAAIIDMEIQAEKTADAPLGHLATLAPTNRVRQFFLAWLEFIDNKLDPWTTGGAIHFRPHWARALMHALVLADTMGLPDVDLQCIAMIATFHDSRRKSPYLDTGHGARAAAYYAQACHEGIVSEQATREPQTIQAAQATLTFDPRAYLVIAWHDKDDADGLDAIATCIKKDQIPGHLGLHSSRYSDLLPAEATADALTMLKLFKDADALDRVRLGTNGLDERYLRTNEARTRIQFARDLLAATAQSK